jgi:GNAT superfamily N-acetyltransferase
MAEGVWDLYWIAVDPKHQGQGLGQVLLRFVENEVRRQSGRMLLIETSSKRSYAPIRFISAATARSQHQGFLQNRGRQGRVLEKNLA